MADLTWTLISFCYGLDSGVTCHSPSHSFFLYCSYSISLSITLSNIFPFNYFPTNAFITRHLFSDTSTSNKVSSQLEHPPNLEPQVQPENNLLLKQSTKISNHFTWVVATDRILFASQIELFHNLLANVVEGNQKAPFSIATTPRCRGRYYSFPWIAPLYPRYVPYIAEC